METTRFSVWLVLAFLQAASWGQQPEFGSLAGRVEDASGAPISRAAVTATSLATGEIFKTTTDERGVFQFAGLRVGDYRLIIETSGFRPVRRLFAVAPHSSNLLGIAEQAEQRVFRLEIGEISEVINVSSGSNDASPVRSKPRPRQALVTLFYATDREPSGRPDPGAFYTGLRRKAPGLAYGTCQVSIPASHRFGELEEPSLIRLEFRPDRKKHVMLVELTTADETAFFGKLRGAVAATGRGEALVFIHGYRNSFHAAALRTAQIAYDLNFDGVPIMYSWPSEDRVLNYKADESNVEWTIPRLESFLTAIAERAGAERVYLVAHSMGSRALTQAMSGLAKRQQTSLQDKFREVILAAPDIDAGVFRDLAAEFNKVAARTTLYASSRDKALNLSKKLAHYVRAGQTGDDLVLVQGVETVDVSDVDTSLLGHSYIGDNASVLSDVFRLLRLGQPAEKRCGLAAQHAANGRFWTFRKDLARKCRLGE